MKRLFAARAFLSAILLLLLGTGASHAGSLINWTNTSGGNWFEPLNWSTHSVPTNGDAATITNNGTYTVYAPTGTVTCTVFTIGGGSGKQTFIYGTPTAGALFLTNSAVQNNGVLVLTNGGAYGMLLVKQGGELQFNSQSSMQLYNFAITNLGTMTWSNGNLTVGGNNNQSTYITNNGIWQIMGDFSIGSGGGNPSVVANSGLIKKMAGSGTLIFGMDVVNLPSGTVDCASGTLRLAPNSTNFLSYSFVAEAGTTMLYTGYESDGVGAVLSGGGVHQFTFGSFYFRTNPIPNLDLVSGDLYIIGTTTFQNAGSITNLTLDGSVLHGNNRISGSLTVKAGNMVDQMTVLPTGQLNLAMTAGTQFYGLNLYNQGTVNWSSGSIAVGGTIISNGGTWTITGDNPMNNGGGTATMTNSGTIQKTAGTGTSTVDGVTLFNQASGIVRVASGSLQMPYSYTNLAGQIQLAGGTLVEGFLSTNCMTGGTLNGSGTIGAPAVYDGGTVAPGPGSALMAFKFGLTLGTNCILSLDGTGTVPGVSYDQLSVTGAVAISNCTLQVTSLPSVPVGTTFVIITNTTANPTTGNFNGLPENAPLTISGQPFRIHYAGGSGNDVVLVRDSGGVATGPQLSSGGYTNKTFKLLGVGSTATIYTIEASTNLVQWTGIGNATGDVSGNFFFTDTNASNYLRRFYRTTN